MPPDRPTAGQRFRWFAELCCDPAFLVTEGGGLVDASSLALEKYGHTIETMRGLHLRDLCAPGANATEPKWEELVQGGDLPLETVHIRRDGSAFPVEMRARTLELESRRHFVVTVRDVTSRKAAEAQFRVAFETNPEAMTLSRLEDGVLVAVNQAFLRRQGRTESEVLGRSSVALGIWTHPEQRQRIMETLRREGAVQDVDIQATRANGSVRTLAYSGRRLDIAGVAYVLGVSRDVTEARARAAERERLSRQLRESEDRLSRILSMMREGVWALDGDGMTTFANPRVGDILGTSHREMIGRSHLDFVPLENRAAAVRMRQEVMSGKELRQEFRHRMPDGSMRQLWSSLSPLRDAEGRVVGSIGVLLDVTDRKLAEDQLAREKERLAVTLQSIGDAVIATDDGGRVTVINAVAEQLTGWTSAEAIGRPLEEVFRIFSEDSRLPVESPVKRVLREGATVGLANHTALVARDGRERAIADSGAPIRDPDGNVSGVVLVFRDQTEERQAERLRRQAEERIRNSERRYRLLADNAQDVIWTLDLATLRSTYVSPSVLRLRGYTPEEVLAQPLEAAFTPDSLAKVKELLATVGTASEPRSHIGIFDQPCRDGSVKHVELTTSVVKDRESSSTELIGVARDATARVAAEQALRENEARFRALIEKSTDMIFVFDEEKRIQFWSPSATECLGWHADEVMGKRLSELGLIHPDDRDAIAEATRGIDAEPQQMTRVAARHSHKDGSWRLVEGMGRNLLEDPAVRGIVVNARDITQQRRLEEQLRQAQKLESVGRLAGGVAHDFNNILTVILSCAEALKLDAEERRQANPEDVEQILSSSWRARDLTRQLLAFARKQIIAPVLLDLNEVTRFNEKLLRRVLGEDVTLVLALAPALWPVLCDQGQMEQVLMNLAVNARDAMPEGGTLTIETRNAVFTEGEASESRGQGSEWVQLLVRDTGVGMGTEVKAHLFEPFFTTKPLGRGTGLGLATVYGIVSQNGGAIHVESEPGRGTTFEIRLARAAGVPAPGKQEDARAVGAMTGTETVLVVEDDPQVRAVTVRVLGEAGYRVLVAGSGREALQIAWAQPGPIDLVVTDVVMPGLNAREMLNELRKSRSGLRALYVSGYAEDAIARHGVLDAGIDLLPKPYTPVTLLARVRKILDGEAAQHPRSTR